MFNYQTTHSDAIVTCTSIRRNADGTKYGFGEGHIGSERQGVYIPASVAAVAPLIVGKSYACGIVSNPRKGKTSGTPYMATKAEPIDVSEHDFDLSRDVVLEVISAAGGFATTDEIMQEMDRYGDYAAMVEFLMYLWGEGVLARIEVKRSTQSAPSEVFWMDAEDTMGGLV